MFHRVVSPDLSVDVMKLNADKAKKDRPSEPGRRVMDAARWKGPGGFAQCLMRPLIGVAIPSVWLLYRHHSVRDTDCKVTEPGIWFGLSRTCPAPFLRGALWQGGTAGHTNRAKNREPPGVIADHVREYLIPALMTVCLGCNGDRSVVKDPRWSSGRHGGSLGRALAILAGFSLWRLIPARAGAALPATRCRTAQGTKRTNDVRRGVITSTPKCTASRLWPPPRPALNPYAIALDDLPLAP